MKKTLLFITVLIMTGTLMAQMPAAITIDPPNATAMDELTLTLSVPDACFESGSLEGVDTVHMHGGVGFSDGTTWQFVIDWNLNGADGTTNGLLPNGDGTYSMTFTPKTYFGVPDTSLAINQICAVFNDGTWDKDGRNFNADSTCTDFFIPLETVGINERKTVSFNIHPNPVNNILNISHLNGAQKVEIYNVIGEIVFSLDNILTDQVKIQTGNLNKGVYMISVINKGNVQSSKFLKN